MVIPDTLDLSKNDSQIIKDTKSILEDEGDATSFRCADEENEIKKEKIPPNKKYQVIYDDICFGKNVAKISAGTLVSIKNPESTHSDIIKRDIEGIIAEDCITNQIAQIKLFNTNYDILYVDRFETKSLKVHKTMFGQNISGKKSIIQMFLNTLQGLYYTICRKFLFSLYKFWNEEIPFTVDKICDKSDLSIWLRFVVLFMTSEKVINISDSNDLNDNNDTLNSLITIYRRLLLSNDEKTRSSITSATIKEIIRNFEPNSQESEEYAFIDSLHPLKTLRNYYGCLSIPQATTIKLSVSPESCIPSSSSIHFYTDPERKKCIETYTSIKQVNNVIIPQNCVYYEFSGCKKSEDWGFRIIIQNCSKLSWKEESDVFIKPNLFWANWLLENVISTALQSDYAINPEIYETMINYIITSGNPYKSKVITMLSKLLSNIQNYKIPFKPDLSIFNEMEHIISDRCYKLFSDKEHYFLPPGILALNELLYHVKIATNYISGTPFLRVNAELPLNPPYSYEISSCDYEPSSSKNLLKSFLEMSILAYSISKKYLISDNIFNDVWLKACYYTRTIETPHPLKSGVYEFNFTFISSSNLQLIFSPLCKFPQGTKIIIKHDDSVITVDTSKLNEPLIFSCSNVYCKIDCSCDIPNNNEYYGILAIIYTSDSCNTTQEKTIIKENVNTIINDLISLKNFSSIADSEIVSFCNRLSKNNKNSALSLDNNNIFLNKNETLLYSFLPNLNHRLFLLRFNVLKYFNKRISQCIRLVDMKNVKENNFLGGLMNSLGSCIFFDLKNQIIQLSIEQTKITGSSIDTSVTLDNAKSLESITNGEIEPNNSQCIFMQYYKQLNEKNAKIYRHSLDDKGRLFNIKYQNESGVDWGGLFRDSISQCVSDLFSDHLTLLIPCPNARNTTNINMDKYVPNPSYSSGNYLSMYEFIGIVMGISLRFEYSLPFDFPSIVWKHMLNIKPNIDDLYQIDTVAVGLLNQLKNENLTEEDFDNLYGDLTFTTPNSIGIDVEVTPGGASIPVTFAKSSHYANLLLQTRLNEYNSQLDSIQKGFGSVVPLHSLSMFTWEELEYLVCGTSVIDLNELKSHTTYSGYTATDLTIQNFWKVLEKWDNNERSLWIRFCWGRSRLPSKKWPNEFKISKQGNVKSLPTAHTCFFSVDLPPYHTFEELEKSMSICIHFGVVGVLNT